MLALNLDLDTWAHRIKASYKLGGLALVSILSYWVESNLVLGLLLGLTALLYISLGWTAFKRGLYLMRPMLWVVILIFAYHAFYENYALGLRIVLRLLFMLSLANFVTMTTRLDDMMAIVERLASCFTFLGVNPRIIAMSCAMVIRFTPILALKGGHLIDAWRSRSMKRPNWRLIVPFCLMALDDAERLAEAIKARGGIQRK